MKSKVQVVMYGDPEKVMEHVGLALSEGLVESFQVLEQEEPKKANPHKRNATAKFNIGDRAKIRYADKRHGMSHDTTGHVEEIKPSHTGYRVRFKPWGHDHNEAWVPESALSLIPPGE